MRVLIPVAVGLALVALCYAAARLWSSFIALGEKRFAEHYREHGDWPFVPEEARSREIDAGRGKRNSRDPALIRTDESIARPHGRVL